MRRLRWSGGPGGLVGAGGSSSSRLAASLASLCVLFGVGAAGVPPAAMAGAPVVAGRWTVSGRAVNLLPTCAASYGLGLVCAVFVQDGRRPESVWVVERHPDGSWAQAREVSDPAERSLSAAVAANAHGQVVVLWTVMVTDEIGRLDATFQDEKGDWSPVHALGQYNGARTIAVALSVNGTAAALWSPWGATYGATGTPNGWTTPRMLSHDGPSTAFSGSQLAVDSAGDGFAVWRRPTGPPDSEGDAHASIYASSLHHMVFGKVRAISPLGDVNRPAVAVDSQGRGVAAWIQATGPFVSDHEQAVVRWRSIAGATLGAARTISGSAFSAYVTNRWNLFDVSVSAAVDADGRAAIAWSGNVKQPPGSSSDILGTVNVAKRNGASFAEPITLPLGPNSDNPFVALAAGGPATAVSWTGNDNSLPPLARSVQLSKGGDWQNATRVPPNSVVVVTARGKAVAVYPHRTGARATLLAVPIS